MARKSSTKVNFKAFKLGDPVKIEWVDPAGDAGWGAERSLTPAIVTSIGYFHAVKDWYVLFCMDKAENMDGIWGTTLALPTQCVTKLTKLKGII